MAVVIITPADLEPFAGIEASKAQAMIEDATATAVRIAPCLKTSTDDDVLAAAKAILRGAILRWDEAGSGQLTQQTAGPFATSYVQAQRKSLFWPSEIEQLQGLCTDDEPGAPFAVDTMPSMTTHVPWCALAFGATYCSCGADIAGEPIFELP